MKAPRSIPLDQHDPWPQRLVICFLGSALLLSISAITWLLDQGRDVTGFYAIPVSLGAVLPMLLSRRPNWTAMTAQNGGALQESER